MSCRRLAFTLEAWQDYQYWQQQDKRVVKKINALIDGTMRQPFEGLGKPERLKENLAGYWSRRINLEHRLVYTVKDGCLIIVQCRYHY